MIELLIVGGGKMGEALLSGLLRAGTGRGDVAVVEPDTERAGQLASAHGVDVHPEPVACSGALIAVKPQYVAPVCESLAGLGVERVLSVAAGVTLATLDASLGADVAAVRAMPNTPALVGRGAAAIAPGAAADEATLDWAEGLLSAVGTVVRVDEAALDAVTGLSGSGPAYVFLIAEAMIEAGVLNGLPRPLATELASHTIAGAGQMLVEGSDPPAQLRSDVTSPGGTTAAGLRALEDHGVRAALLDAVSRAAARSKELGGG